MNEEDNGLNPKEEIVEVQPEVEKKETVQSVGNQKGLCIASMVCGILSILLMCVQYSYIAAIIAIILGVIGLKTTEGKNFAIAGIVTGAISIILSILIIIVGLILYGTATAAMLTMQ